MKDNNITINLPLPSGHVETLTLEQLQNLKRDIESVLPSKSIDIPLPLPAREDPPFCPPPYYIQTLLRYEPPLPPGSPKFTCRSDNHPE